MTLIELAVKHERWDLAAHVIVLAAARALNEEVKGNGKESKTLSGRSAQQ